ncbi:hypothetical protein E4T46_08793 [Aureobasidium subglaciale]|nr:hypothetical protein E4T40_08849 [Aureobasidium subglaciale]KAI5255133.1 hypothetical protein E4T46_08793 [Aureobasidium subglaciale]
MSDNGLQRFGHTSSEDADPDNSLPCIPTMATPCCCGNDDCAFQQENNQAFALLDENLRRAGQVGKALLVRHEAYVAEAEEQKALMDAEITRMTAEKQQAEAKNSSLIEENRNLLDQLEGLNNVVVESDAHTESLIGQLLSTQAELLRLSTLAARTERLEREVDEYEQEQALLHASLTSKVESERSATLRWQEAERKLAVMEEQLDRIEREARDDKERHVEIVGRMERQRVVEKELETSAGRLNGAASAKTARHGSTVVSHFVKDILQDNVNLQAGIAELREMLDNSNEQVEVLRDQLAQYTPTDMASDTESPAPSTRPPNLDNEMKRASSQEVHVHHHYHAPAEHSRKASLTLRRPKKKRNVLASGLFTPSTGSRTPRTSISAASPYTPSSTAAILSQTAASIPHRNVNRWSMQSHMTTSSMLSSPQSIYPPSSIWDRDDSLIDSSRPTTPDSEAPSSPYYISHQSKRSSTGSYFRALSQPAFRDGASDRFEDHDQSSYNFSAESQGWTDDQAVAGGHGAILEEDEGNHLDSTMSSVDESRPHLPSFIDDTEISTYTRPTILDESIYSRPRHRRAASHESLISVSGMDIHTLQSRPSQLLTAQSSRSFSSQASVTATLSLAHAARPALISRTSSNSRSILQGVAAEHKASSTPPKGLGQRMGGWVFGKWGSTPTPTVTVSAPMDHIKVDKKRMSTTASKLRPPGINQAGPIFGFGPEPQLPREPILKTLNEEELWECLNE